MVNSLQGVMSNLSWHSGGAITAFSTYMWFVGVDFARDIHDKLYPLDGSNCDRASRIVGMGMLINFVSQSLIVTLGCGFSTGTAAEMTGVGINGNKAIVAWIVFIAVWTKVFGESSWLSRLFSAVIGWTFR
nr:hypothetical protein B0A51_12236 [Rachicladosporium sp. CCFEE 5018]